MKFEKYGEYKQNLTIEIKPLEHAEYSIFKELNILLEFIQKAMPEIFQTFIEKLTKKLRTIVEEDYFVDKDSAILELSKDYDHLKSQQELVKLHLNVFLHKLGISTEQFFANKKETFTDKNFFQSANYLFCNHLTVLIDILGRENALNFYKVHVAHYVFTYDTNQKGIYPTLDVMREKSIRFIQSGRYGRVRIMSDVVDGRFIIRCENCEKAAALSDMNIEDKELIHTTLCYVHFPLAKMWNKHFVLTQKQTIAKGDRYCEYAYHDTRIVDKIEHPPREFFDKIMPLHKES